MKILILVFVALAFVVLGLLLRQAKTPKKKESPDEFMANMAAQAVRHARDGYDVELDYSLQSVQKVEGVLGQLHEMYATREDKRGIHACAIIFGAYIGETLKRHLGDGHWERDHPVGGEKSWPFVSKDGDAVSFPYVWCGKRIECGPEDNVWHKLQVLLSEVTPNQQHNSMQAAPDGAPDR